KGGQGGFPLISSTLSGKPDTPLDTFRKILKIFSKFIKIGIKIENNTCLEFEFFVNMNCLNYNFIKLIQRKVRHENACNFTTHTHTHTHDYTAVTEMFSGLAY
ncbi:MAG: hypothetical protein QG635_873, partial [Bacteroidota bacterium]|nr:hypothetical protein [Bacteroidota bacterium]